MKSFLPLFMAFLLSACPKTSEPHPKAQALHALTQLLEAAKTNNAGAFKNGLSDNFILVIKRYQEMAAQRPEIKGAFSIETFMRGFIRSNPKPIEVLVKKDHVQIKAQKPDGSLTEVRMINEKGKWVLAVPPGMVKSLDHFDAMAKKMKDSAVKAPELGPHQSASVPESRQP